MAKSHGTPPAEGRETKAQILERTEREKVKFLRLQFTDILGTIKNVEIPDRQFEDALDGKIMFDGSSIEGFVRIEESDMYLRPDLSTFRVFPWPGTTGEKVARMICDIYTPDGQPFIGDPRACLKKVIAHGRREGLRDERRARGRVLPLPDQERRRHHRDARRRQLLRPEPGRPGRGRPARDRARARGDGLSRRGGAPRGRARPARDRLPLRRCADDGRQHQHVPLRREERRDQERPARDLHAQADLRHQRLRHAHAHVAVLGRHEHLLRRQGAVAAERDLPELHRRHPAPREGLLRDHQPAGEFLQAAGARLRSADQHRVVGEEPQPARARAGGARHVDAHRAAHARSVVQSVSRAGGDAARRASTASRRRSIPGRRSTRTSTR